MRISDWSSDVCSSDLLTLRMDISTDAPDSIETDPLRLEQVLKNFLSNAVKFTHNGEVVLHISSTAEDCLAFTVRDTGIGIAPDQQQMIFEAFRQADGTASRQYGGTGLGLSISRELARLLGGKITRSEEHTSELQSLMRISYAVFCLTKK